MITNDARRTSEIKSSIVATKASSNKKTFFTSKLYFKFKEEIYKVLHVERSFVWCWNVDISEKGP